MVLGSGLNSEGRTSIRRVRGYESANSSSDVDGVGGNVPNREHGLESEVEMDEVGEGQERNEEGVGMGG